MLATFYWTAASGQRSSVTIYMFLNNIFLHRHRIKRTCRFAFPHKHDSFFYLSVARFTVEHRCPAGLRDPNLHSCQMCVKQLLAGKRRWLPHSAAWKGTRLILGEHHTHTNPPAAFESLHEFTFNPQELVYTHKTNYRGTAKQTLAMHTHAPCTAESARTGGSQG